jgi:hypothetical protein
LSETDILRETEAFSSVDWLFPPRIPFNAVLENRCEWGGILLELCVSGERVERAECVSDAMDEGLICRIREALPGCPYCGKELAARVTAAASADEDAVTGTEMRIRIGRDIAELLRAQIP